MEIVFFIFLFITEGTRLAEGGRGSPVRDFPPVARLSLHPHTGLLEQPQNEEFAIMTEKADTWMETREREDEQLLKDNFYVKEKTPSAFHQFLMSTTDDLIEVAVHSIAIEAAAKMTAEKSYRPAYSPYNLSFFHNQLSLPSVLPEDESKAHHGKARKRVRRSSLPRTPFIPISIKNTAFGRTHCHKPIPCQPCERFRTYDGSCNNVAVPLVGKAGTPQIRLLPPSYEDPYVLKDPRATSVSGDPLPCAREASQVLAQSTSKPDADHSMMVMQWGQFVDHDLVLSPTFKLGYSSKGIECCDDKIRKHSECFPICIPVKDPFFHRYKRTCMNFVRTQSSPTIDCTMGARQQMNALTHYLDGSNVYGSSEREALDLREKSGGRMKVQQPGDILPPQTNGGECRSTRECFRAGDERVNEQPNLALTHTLWVREHNRIAAHYSDMGYESEDAFQLARRLVIAQIQHITYNEFLPIVLGEKYMELRGMKPATSGYFTGYDPTIDASISNAFAAAAYRFGHSMLDTFIQRHSMVPTWDWSSDLFSRGGKINFGRLHDASYRRQYEIGLFTQPIQSVDMCFTKEVTEQLFVERSGSGFDLVALNIQRGRDHGIPPYVFYRDLYCLSYGLPLTDFNDMTWLTTAQIERLKSVYQSLKDMDLFVGGLLEPPIFGGGLVGETFQCIIGDQFFRTKYGDRYFYENKDQPFPFTPKQLNEIRKVTLARIFCDNGDNIDKITREVFKMYKFRRSSPREPNLPVSCTKILKMDLSFFN